MMSQDLVATWLPPRERQEEWTARGFWRGVALDRLVTEAADRDPRGVAVVDADRAVTFAELESLVDRCARFLRALGVRPGEVVAWQLPNCLEAVVLFFAVARLRAVSLPVVPIYRERELTFLCEQSGAVALVVPSTLRGYDHASLAEKVRAAVPSLRQCHVIDLVTEPEANWPAADETVPELPVPTATDIAALLYTSGTESNPKGVLHSHTGLVYDAQTMVRLLGLDGRDVFFMPSPLTHVTGLLNGVVAPVLTGGTVVLQQVWNPDEALRLVRRYRCTYSVLSTPFLQQMFAGPDAEAAMASFRFIRCGGTDIPGSLMASANRVGVTILRVYGLTEVPTVTCVPPDATERQRASTDGAAMENVSLRLIGADGKPVGPGTVGEIETAGPEMFLGYTDPAVNAAAFTADGYFRTGDLGVVDDDGFLRICGRAKDIIIRGGENLSAAEVEEALSACPGVDDVAVIGVPDEVLGERACAFVVSTAVPPPELADLRRAVLAAGLAIQKSPEHLRYVPELPRTPAGKVRKARLREWFSGEGA